MLSRAGAGSFLTDPIKRAPSTSSQERIHPRESTGRSRVRDYSQNNPLSAQLYLCPQRRRTCGADEFHTGDAGSEGLDVLLPYYVGAC